MNLKLLLRIGTLAILVFRLLALIPSVSAHGSTHVGDYELEIGFRSEPAYQGLPNGLELLVKNMKTNQPVSGLEETLQVEVIFGTSKKELRLEPLGDEAGAYTADLIPTRAGDYTFHIFGKIEDTPVDVSLTSSPTTFASVEAQADYAFPGGADLQQEVNSARQLAMAGLAVGSLGLLAGIVGIFMALRAARKGL